MEQGRSLKKKFLREVDSRNRAFRPLRAALYVLQAEEPAQRVEFIELLLREWTRTLAPKLAREAQPYQKIRSLNSFFFEELGFRQCVGDEGSEGIDLHEVMVGRRGLPITLALIYQDLSLRLGIPLHALSYPGHLLFASAWLGRGNFLDLADGAIVGLDESRHRVELRDGKQLVLIKPEQLSMLSDRQLLERYLGTLKGIHLAEGRLDAALRVAEWKLLLAPDSLFARWERGLILYGLNRFSDAQRDLGNLLVRGVAIRRDARNLARARVCALLSSLQDPRR